MPKCKRAVISVLFFKTILIRTLKKNIMMRVIVVYTYYYMACNIGFFFSIKKLTLHQKCVIIIL